MPRETVITDITTEPDDGLVRFAVARCEDGVRVSVHRACHSSTDDPAQALDQIDALRGEFPVINEADRQAVVAAFSACPPPPASAPTLDDLKAEALTRIRYRCDALFRGGYLYDFGGDIGPRRLDLRTADDKINWTLLLQEANAYVAGGAGAMTTTVRDAENNPAFDVTYTVAKTFTEAMLAWGKAVYGRKWQLDEEVMAASDEAALAAIDVTAGWP